MASLPLLLALLGLLVQLACSVEHVMTPAAAFAAIKEHLLTVKKENLPVEDSKSCTMSNANSCPLSSMGVDESTIVYPGGQTRCIFTTSTKFGFQVIKGKTDKLLVHFQGGGACWDKVTTIDSPMCTTDISAQRLIGMFDRENSLNAYKDFTIVELLYCSGDVWGGNVTQSYKDSAGEPVVQHGMLNALSVIDWIDSQQKNGNLAANLNKLVVSGCSAGSIGAQLWSSEIVNRIKHSTAAVLPDSYAGVFPDGTQGPLVKSLGFCTAKFLTQDLRNKCNNAQLSLQDIMASLMSSIPKVPFSWLQSKVDVVQQSFYVAVGLSMYPDGATAEITPSQFYDDVNTIFGGYNKHPNFMTYLVDGPQHCFTPLTLYYTADTLGPLNDGNGNTGPTVAEYFNTFPLAKGGKEETECQGQVQGLVASTDDGKNDYCSSTVVPKNFVQE